MLDLFAGIGGFSLAGHWAGWETVAFVEWDSFCQKVLNKNFPNVPVYGDIKQFDGTQYTRTVDIICGGFPCQPFSDAGKRKGTADDRYLWPEMLRVIREVQPAWVVGENVAGLISMDGGVVLESVCADLEGEGYSVQPFVIPACAVGAPHERERIWIVAHLDQQGLPGIFCGKLRGLPQAVKSQQRGKPSRVHPKAEQWEEHWSEVITRLCGIHDGLSRRVDRHRAKRLKALGNAIVPQAAYQIFQAINEQV